MLQGLHPDVQEALAPQGRLAPIQIDLGGDVLVLPALSANNTIVALYCTRASTRPSLV
jgi:hypothetical protein